MPFSAADLQAASAAQTAAATCPASRVRLIAGPGAGKSKTIEERVGWLLGNEVQPATIAVVSFTRASAQDLRLRIREYSAQNNIRDAEQVPVTTLHSLALRVLRGAGLLAQYPVDPIVLTDWETTNIFDTEFAAVSGIGRPRCQQIRRHNEAFWQTGSFNPPNFVPPNPPITQAEQAAFQAFHAARTQLYSCVLPGEIIRQCVEATRAGVLNPNNLLHLQHLIVDEFQDLNPLDQEFVDHFIASGVRTFICGDDDQSVYSFRFAAPQGIQGFIAKYANSVDHALQHCFRYGANILAAGATLMAQFPVPNRIPKIFNSMYVNSLPPIPGDVFRWRFNSGTDEAHGIATVCRNLIAAGLDPKDILILLSNSRALAGQIENALAQANVPFEGVREKRFADTDGGRVILACLRVVCDANDYVALRILLGELPSVAVGTCNAIATATIANNLNFRALFYAPLTPGVFSVRATNALTRMRTLCATLDQWLPTETLALRSAAIGAALEIAFGLQYRLDWESFAAPFPQDITLQELRDLMSATTDEQIAALSKEIHTRLGLPEPDEGFVPSKVRIMTMHGAKGLSSKVVFVPGLEDEIFPGDRRAPYPGLVLEGARLLYVSITRARAACFMSYAVSRFVNGNNSAQTPSRYAVHTNGPFQNFPGLTPQQINGILAAIQSL